MLYWFNDAKVRKKSEIAELFYEFNTILTHWGFFLNLR